MDANIASKPRIQAVRRAMSPVELVRRSEIAGGQTRLRLVTPAHPKVDLAAWLRANQKEVDAALLEYGGILLRGFEGAWDELFPRVVQSTIRELQPYLEGATPRTALGEGVYTSTEFPEDQTIAQHNELSYVNHWPMKICFGCKTAPEHGGATPLTDVRQVLANLDPELVREFAARGWMLIRNYGAGLGPGWRKVFATDSLDDVRRYCTQSGIELEILGSDRLRTRQVRPAIRRHPVSGAAVWFNHIAFWHPYSLDDTVRRGLEAQFGHDELPYATCWGDGARIERDVIDHINDAYRRATLTTPWQQGDIVLLDNMLIAHGRAPFRGKRAIVVSMGEPYPGDTSNNLVSGEKSK